MWCWHSKASTSVQFPLHDCYGVGIFIWEFIVLQKGKRSRDLIPCCHGNSHGQLHGPKTRNCPAMWSEPPPWSCQLLDALSHRNKSFIAHEVLYSGYSTHIPRHLTSAGLSMPRSQPWEGLVTLSLLTWEGRPCMAPSHSSATPAPQPQPWQPLQGAALQHHSVNTCSFQTDTQEYWIWSGGMGPTQVLSDYKHHSWSAVSKDKIEFVWLHDPKNQTWSPSWSSSSVPWSTTLLTPLSEAAHQFSSDLASQNLTNIWVKTCFGR